MIYTYKKGVDRQFKQKAVKGGGIILPIASLLFLIIAALSFSSSQGSGQSPNIPVSKPQKVAAAPATGAKPGTKPSNSSSPSGSSSGPSGPGGGGQTAAAPAMSPATLGGLSPATGTSPSPSPTGGLGGGDITGSTTPTSSPTSSTGGTGSTGSGGTTTGTGGTSSGGSTTPTVVCTNALTLAQICTACTPPLTLQPGQKAILSADGTCVAVN